MTNPTYDVVAIGNAIVDILASAEDDFIAEQGMTKGAMQLVFSTEEADALYDKMGPGREISGARPPTRWRASPRWAARRPLSARSPTIS